MTFMPPPMRTMGVRVTNGGIECIWCPDFVEKRTLEELIATIQHEIEHLLRLHCIRGHGSKEKFLWNIAADMCVNGRADSPRIGYQEGQNLILPFGADSKKHMVWIPEKWAQGETAEYYYEQLQTSDDETAKMYREAAEGAEIYGWMVDNHDFWQETEMTPEEIRQIIRDVAQQSVEKARGNVPGHVAGLLETLADPIVSWRQLLRNYFGRHLGSRRKTYNRRDRRRDIFGSKGISHHAAAKASVIVDTSGSISQDELQQFFAEIESIAYKARVCMLQWDADFQGFTPRYRRGDWKKIEIKGRGGTSMDAAVDWIEANGLAGDVCILLTDGYTPWPDPKPFPMINCITSEVEGPPWGHVIRLKDM